MTDRQASGSPVVEATAFDGTALNSVIRAFLLQPDVMLTAAVELLSTCPSSPHPPAEEPASDGVAAAAAAAAAAASPRHHGGGSPCEGGGDDRGGEGGSSGWQAGGAESCEPASEYLRRQAVRFLLLVRRWMQRIECNERHNVDVRDYPPTPPHLSSPPPFLPSSLSCQLPSSPSLIPMLCLLGF